MKWALSSEERAQLVRVAQGQEKADLVLLNGHLLNVYTGEILPEHSVAIRGERIAYVGRNPSPCLGPQTQVIEIQGKTMVPGFIDAHTHFYDYGSPIELIKHVIPTGTTTIITETMEIAYSLGYRGLREYLASLKDQPIKVLGTVPAMSGPSPLTYRLSPGEIRRLLRRDDVVGVGETYWSPVVLGAPRLQELFQESERAGKAIQGHSAGAREHKLAAYVASGVACCHEPITIEEVLERLRLGIYVLIREGSVRRELEALAPLKDMGVDLRHLALTSDGLDPMDLLRRGQMDFIVQKAINLGFSPVQAVQMATLNAAQCFSLDKHIGGIAPGRYADILVLPQPDTIRPEYVISSGQVIARQGRVLVSARNHRFPRWFCSSLTLLPGLMAEDFALSVDGAAPEVTVRVIEYTTDLLTREAQVALPVSQGLLKPNPEQDILKVAAIERTLQPGQKFVGFIRGFGLRKGAFACNDTWDSTSLIVVGANEEDMAGAANRVLELQGGVVVFVEGKVVAELPTPLAGYMSPLPVEELAQKMELVTQKVKELGCPFPHPHLSLRTLATGAIPFFRITEQGLVRIRDYKLLGLLV